MDIEITTSEENLDVDNIRKTLENAGYFVGEITIVRRPQ